MAATLWHTVAITTSGRRARIVPVWPGPTSDDGRWIDLCLAALRGLSRAERRGSLVDDVYRGIGAGTVSIARRRIAIVVLLN